VYPAFAIVVLLTGLSTLALGIVLRAVQMDIQLAFLISCALRFFQGSLIALSSKATHRYLNF